ncbi:MAG: hypothetical protein V1866_06955 [archaeon]
MRIIYLSEYLRMLLRRIKIVFSGIRHYEGDALAIGRQVIDDCYNREKKYFMVSPGNYCEFYARDFGWCVESLLSLGERDRVINTLSYALAIFEKHGRIEQTINPSGKPFTFPDAQFSDALPFLVHSLRLTHAGNLIKKHRNFLNREIMRYFDGVIDGGTGLVRRDVHISSMKDYALRQSSCYDNSLIGMLANDISALSASGLVNPFKKYDYTLLLIRHFWTGKYFLDDLSGAKTICGDANTMPFWTGVIRDKKILLKVMKAVQKEGLDRPFPLKYTSGRFKEQKMIATEFLAGNYERDAVWAHAGLMYIKVVAEADKALAKGYLAEYERQMLRHKNFLEVYDRSGKPFKTIAYYTDESMLWAANYLSLRKLLS